MKKALSFTLLVFILLPGSAFHDMILVIVLAYVWRDEIKSRADRYWKYANASLWSLLCLLTLLLMPRPFALPSDRVRLLHLNEKGERISAPLSHWAVNLLLPEETICAVSSFVPLTPMKHLIPVGDGILKDYYYELKTGGLFNIGRAFRSNNLAIESPMSGAITQAINQFSGGKTRSVYVIRPKDYDKNRQYPVLFFAHGFLGNWKMYTGLLRKIKGHIVVCIGTEDLSGIFTRRHIDEIKTVYLPMLEDMGYSVDRKAVSLMGLSNGGSAVDAAYSTADDYKNLIYVSTEVNRTYKTSTKVMVIGGGRDHCAPMMKNGMAKLVSNGVNTAFCFDDNHTHLKLISDMDNCINFLNNEL